jgi:hypothetical protein
VSSGAVEDIWNGETMYVGTSAGAADKGKIRIRSGTASNELIVAESTHIDWKDDDYLTIVKYFEPWGMLPTLVASVPGDDNAALIIYKDYDVPYTSQNSDLGSFINMGCHYAGFREYVAVPELLLNTSFETDTVNWTLTCGADSLCVRDPAFGHAGSCSVLMYSFGDAFADKWATLLSDPVNVVAGISYQLSLWIYNDSLTGGVTYQAKVNWYDIGSALISSDTYNIPQATSGWIHISETQTAPAGAVTATIEVSHSILAVGTMTSHIDDFSFTAPVPNEVQVYYSASGTYNLKGQGISYEWFFEGGDPTGSYDRTPGYVGYSVSGHYTTCLIVTVTGTSIFDTSYRHISIYDRPEDGSNNPILNWEMSDLSGARDQGGYTSTIKIRQNVPEGIIRENALVVIFADDWYGNSASQQHIGGSSQGRESIVFVGYILDGSIEYNWQEGSISFDVGSITEIMKNRSGVGLDVESKTSPDNWGELVDLDGKRSAYHYWKWHSTVLYCSDVEWVGTDQKIQYFSPDRDSLHNAIYNFMEGAYLGKSVADRQSKIWLEVGLDRLDNVTGTYPINMYMNRWDWMNNISIDERTVAPVSYLECGGFAMSGTSGSIPLLSCAPGDVPSFEGSLEAHEGLALSDQVQLNALCGNLYAYMNAKYPTVAMDITGNYRNLDIAPQQLLLLNVDYTDTPRNLIWTDKAFHITDMNWTYQPDKSFFSPSMVLHEVTQGFPGTTIIIPPVAPETPEPVDIPKIPIITGSIITPPIIINTGLPDTVFVAGNKLISAVPELYGWALGKTANFTSISPTWTNMLPSNVSGTVGGYAGAGCIEFVLNPLDANYSSGYWMSDYGIWYLSGLNAASGTNVIAMPLLSKAQAIALVGSPSVSYFLRMIVSRAAPLTTVYVLFFGDNKLFLLSNVALSPTWTWAEITVATAGNRFHKGVGFACGEIGSNLIYACMGMGDLAVSYSNGGSWSVPWSSSCGYYTDNALFLPRCGLLLDQMVYVIGWTGTYPHNTNFVFRSDDGFVTPPTNVSPSYNGHPYGGIEDTIYAHACGMSMGVTGANTIALLAYRGDSNYNRDMSIFTSMDGGNSWAHKYNWTNATTSCMLRGLVMHPYNEKILFVMAGTTSLSPYLGSILASIDGGLTWLNKSGNWNTIFGCGPNKYADDCNTNEGGFIFPCFK